MRQFSNIVLLTSLSFTKSTSQDYRKNWTNLIDGNTFKGWMKLAGNASYTLSDGVITGCTVLKTLNTFLSTENEYDNFILELEVMIEDSTSNSGIQFRSHFNSSANMGKGIVYRYQYELAPSLRRCTGGVYDEGRREWLYLLMLNPSEQNAYKHGFFNKVRIECIGTTIKTWVNEITTVCLIDTFDRNGFIALQVHSISRPEMAGRKIH